MPKQRHAIELEKLGESWRVLAPKLPGCVGVGTTPVTALRSFAAQLVIGAQSGAPSEIMRVVDEIVSGDALSRVLEAEEQPQPSSTRSRRSREPTEARVLQLKVTLKHCRPPIWRRLLVPGAMTLDRLHDVLQVAMGWTDSHLHAFVSGDDIYQIPDPDFGSMRPVIDERSVAVGIILRKVKDALRYDYDFGDGWEHDIVLEKVHPASIEQRVPTVIEGRRACPPEDVGGPHGYGHLLAALSDSTHAQHDDMVEWIGREVDPDEFDVEDTDACVARLAKRRTRGRRGRS